MVGDQLSASNFFFIMVFKEKFPPPTPLAIPIIQLAPVNLAVKHNETCCFVQICKVLRLVTQGV